MPNGQNHECAQGRADQTSTLIMSVPAYALAKEGGDKGAGDSQCYRQEEALRIVRSRHEKAGNDAGDTADDRDPDDAGHDELSCWRG